MSDPTDLDEAPPPDERDSAATSPRPEDEDDYRPPPLVDRLQREVDEQWVHYRDDVVYEEASERISYSAQGRWDDRYLALFRYLSDGPTPVLIKEEPQPLPSRLSQSMRLWTGDTHLQGMTLPPAIAPAGLIEAEPLPPLENAPPPPAPWQTQPLPQLLGRPMPAPKDNKVVQAHLNDVRSRFVLHELQRKLAFENNPYRHWVEEEKPQPEPSQQPAVKAPATSPRRGGRLKLGNDARALEALKKLMSDAAALRKPPLKLILLPGQIGRMPMPAAPPIGPVKSRAKKAAKAYARAAVRVVKKRGRGLAPPPATRSDIPAEMFNSFIGNFTLTLDADRHALVLQSRLQPPPQTGL
jgi:hypothetical protein